MTLSKKPREYTTPSEYGLPYEDWRSGQLEAIDWIQNDGWLFNRDDAPVKVIEAPTGSGKTGIVLTLSAMYPELRFLVLCATKLEQDQYESNITEEYKGFISIKGRNNFHCILDDEDVEEKCERSPCYSVHVDEARCTLPDKNFECPVKYKCPYFKQLTDIESKKVVVTNYAYGLTILNFLKDRMGKFDVIVEDEGHVLDTMLEQFIEVRLWRRQIKKLYGLDLPDFETVREWQHWCEQNKSLIEGLFEEMSKRSVQDMSKEELNLARGAKNVKESFEKIENMNLDWIVEKDNNSVPMKPVWITKDSLPFLFQHAPRHIVMSGTIPSFQELAKKVGIPQEQYFAKRLPYVFPIENRPIYIEPVANMSAKYIDMSLPVMLQEIDRIITANMNKKILIHTVNYKISNYISRYSKYKSHIFAHDSKNRIETLNRFKKSITPAILISPSFDKAVDLPDDECELIIIAKIPFPFLGSKVMRKRLSESRRYYDAETLSTVIQMAGRGVRKETDVCPTIILDSGASSFIKRCRAQKLIPDGIEQAIQGV